MGPFSMLRIPRFEARRRLDMQGLPKRKRPLERNPGACGCSRQPRDAAELAAGRENFQRYRSDPIIRENYDSNTARRVLQEPSSNEEGLSQVTFVLSVDRTRAFGSRARERMKRDSL